MSNEPQRYRFSHAGMVECRDGKYVKWEDALALLADLDATPESAEPPQEQSADE